MNALLYAIGDGRAFLREWTGPPPEPTTEALAEHERVVSRLMEREAVLPVRFGTVVEDEAEVRELLVARREELRAALERVRGAVEIGVRASWTVVDAAGDSGAEYMYGRLRAQRRADEVARGLEPLAPLARSARRRMLPRPSGPLVAAYLVDRDKVNEFVARVADLDRELEGVELVCTGPWPPYSFAEGVAA